MAQPHSSSVQTVTSSVQPVQYVELQENEISSSVEVHIPLVASSTAHLEQESVSTESSRLPPRIRRKKRPYSPDSTWDSQRSLVQKRSFKTDSEGTPLPCPKPFKCARCKNPYVVNPSRTHSSSKTYGPRRVFDPVIKKHIVVCNACRLALTRPRKEKFSNKVLPPSDEEKEAFVKECEQFAASLVNALQDPDAARLFCPSFVFKQCLCLQKYLSTPDDEENIKRSQSLLDLLKKAKQLSTQKKFLPDTPPPKKGQKTGRSHGLMRMRCREFEEFVLETRKYLRLELKFCERASQRVLMYSNNFLHKKLKSIPDKAPRIKGMEEKSMIGGNCLRKTLKPISELHKQACCRDHCMLIALTHSRLLEDWRAAASRGQKDARRAIAEMLTPSGGSKANCFKFIKMVTGCSNNTLCHVNEQMRRTKGDREPPEHGLKKYWRQQGKQGGVPTEEEEEEEVGLVEVPVPSSEELQALGPEEARRRLQEHSQQLSLMQRQLKRQQQKLAQMCRQRTRPPLILGCCTEAAETQPAQTTVPIVIPASTPAAAPPQLVHFLNVPATPQVVVNVNMVEPQPQIQAPPLQPQLQSAISVLNAHGELEPVTSVSVIPGQPMGNVFILPECETVTLPLQECETVFTSVAPEVEQLQLHVNPQPLTQVQLSSMPMQYIDLPVQFAVQPAVQLSVQPTIEPSVQSEMQLRVRHLAQTEAQLVVETGGRSPEFLVETEVNSPELVIETEVESPQSTTESEFLSPQPMVDTSVQTSERNFSPMADQHSNQTSEENINETCNKNLNQASDQMFVQAANQASDQMSIHATDQPSHQMLGQASDQMSIHATDQPSHQMLGQASDQMSIHATDQPSVQASDQMSIHATDQPSVQTSDQMSVQVANQISHHISVEASDQRTVKAADQTSRQMLGLASDQMSVQAPAQTFGQPSTQEMVHCSVQTSIQGSPAGESGTVQSQEVLLSPQPLAFEMEVQTSPPSDGLVQGAPTSASALNVKDRETQFPTNELPQVYYVDSL